jgi:preprotein translocase subunit SecF
MMQFFHETRIDFLKYSKLCGALSVGIILLGGVLALSRGGLPLSVDFTGGTTVELSISPAVDVGRVRDILNDAGLAPEQVTTFGSAEEILVNLAAAHAAEQASDAATAAASVRKVVAEALPGSTVELRRQESVGPRIGSELKTAAVNSLVIAMLLIMVYISIRFVFQYALGAVVAVFHDVLVTVAFFALFNKEISLAVVAALLTIVGYSVNDTIVVFDRIRENLHLRRKETFAEIINRSVNETLSRTIITNGTVILVSLVLFFAGGSVIHDFAFAMVVGSIVGTYSSIYIASPVVLLWHNWRMGQMQRTKRTPAPAA